MPLPRFQNLAEGKRSLLLGVGAKEFAAKGFEAASLNEILAAAGLGKSSYYYYFEDKEDLFTACMLDAMKALFAQAPPFDIGALDAANFWSTLEEYVRAVVALSSRESVSLALFRSLPSVRGHLAARFRAATEHMMTPILGVVRKGQALGRIRTDMPAARLLHICIAADGALDDTFITGDANPGPAVYEAHGRLVFDTWRRLLAPSSPTSAS